VPRGRPQVPGPGVSPVADAEVDALRLTPGRTIYLPIYSHIYSSNTADPILLAVTVSVRNPDAGTSIVVKRVSYRNSGGDLVRDYLPAPMKIAPLAAAEFFIPEGDTQGGAGASFVIEWLAQGPVSEPIVEAIHIHTLGGQGLVFTTWGRPVASRASGPESNPAPE
jgi:hypothetical protein